MPSWSITEASTHNLTPFSEFEKTQDQQFCVFHWFRKRFFCSFLQEHIVPQGQRWGDGERNVLGIQSFTLRLDLTFVVARLRETPSDSHLLVFSSLCNPFHIKYSLWQTGPDFLHANTDMCTNVYTNTHSCVIC